MNIILADANKHNALKPLSWTRPLADIRTGILTNRERWERVIGSASSTITEEYLSEKWGLKKEDDNLVINASVLPDENLVSEIKSLKNKALVKNKVLIAVNCPASNVEDVFNNLPADYKEYEEDINFINHPWDIFGFAGIMIKFDFNLITRGRKSQKLSDTNIIIGDNPVFIEEGAKVEASVINTTKGPVYIGRDAEIMESCSVRGPFAMGEHSVLKMSAKVYGPTVLGPWVKTGGELNNVVFQAFSNKAHDGFLGNAVIGEWCNIGADSNNSNLKNNYDEVKMWDYETSHFSKTGLQFCGLIMGDHSKCGINTMFNTGTVIGVSCNIFGQGFPRNFIPSFSWGGFGGYKEYKLKKALEVASIVMERRKLELNDIDKNILNQIFEKTTKYRKF